MTFGRTRLLQAGTAFTATLLLAGTAAPLQAAPGDAGATTTTQTGATSDKRICVEMDMPGTRISRKVCRTQAEWDREGGVPNK